MSTRVDVRKKERAPRARAPGRKEPSAAATDPAGRHRPPPPPPPPPPTPPPAAAANNNRNPGAPWAAPPTMSHPDFDPAKVGWGVLLGTVEYRPEDYDAEFFRPSSARARGKGRGFSFRSKTRVYAGNEKTNPFGGGGFSFRSRRTHVLLAVVSLCALLWSSTGCCYVRAIVARLSSLSGMLGTHQRRVAHPAGVKHGEFVRHPASGHARGVCSTSSEWSCTGGLFDIQRVVKHGEFVRHPATGQARGICYDIFQRGRGLVHGYDIFQRGEKPDRSCCPRWTMLFSTCTHHISVVRIGQNFP